MPIDQLIFVGLNGLVAALHRDTGRLVWKSEPLSGRMVTLLLDGDRLIVSSSGFMYCLEPSTGKLIWENRMKGFGLEAPTSIVSVRGQSNQDLYQVQSRQESDQAGTAVI